MNPKVDTFLENATNWQEEMTFLRQIVLDCHLNEELKWGVPCYDLNTANVVLIHGFKEYCALLFHKGVLLKDSEGILIQQTENVQSARQIRFSSVQQIKAQEATIKAYIYEAIEVEKAGLKVALKKTTEYTIPNELQIKLDTDLTFKNAFEGLTPGRQRGYIYHIASAKQEKTRISRIEDNTTRILNGYGFNDCVCGKSKRMPNCDGSHKFA